MKTPPPALTPVLLLSLGLMSSPSRAAGSTPPHPQAPAVRGCITDSSAAPKEGASPSQPCVFSEEVTVVGTRLAGSAETLERLPGSVDVLDRRQLEISRVLTVNEALQKAAGVNVRDEEGMALRPNIGIRGLNPTRSSKTRAARGRPLRHLRPIL